MILLMNNRPSCQDALPFNVGSPPAEGASMLMEAPSMLMKKQKVAYFHANEEAEGEMKQEILPVRK